MGRRCRIQGCLSDSKFERDAGVTFHKIPPHSDIRPKWLSLCHIPEDPNLTKIIYVCSRHFRNSDFCKFKGRKYILKHGVLPSIFPWTAIKSNDQEDIKPDINELALSENKQTTDTIETVEPIIKTELLTTDIKTEVIEEPTIKQEIKETESEDAVLKSSQEFSQGMKVEATDFNGVWLPAEVVEVDLSENEVLIEFDKSTNKSNEWIPMDSKRLRPLRSKKQQRNEAFEPGERVMAVWGNLKFPATIQKSVNEDSYEVLFDDGIKIILKASKISKSNLAPAPMSSPPSKSHPSPLFAPVEGTKQERRDKKRKINVAELFHKKRPKHEPGVPPEKPKHVVSEAIVEKKKKEKKVVEKEELLDVSTKSLDVSLDAEGLKDDGWVCEWVDGQPVGTPSFVDNRKSIIVTDTRLPEGWTKHLVCRSFGVSAGKWDAIIISPEGRKFRSKTEIKSYLDQEKPGHNFDQFDFSLHIKRSKFLGMYKGSPKPVTPKIPSSTAAKQSPKMMSPKVDTEKTEVIDSSHVKAEDLKIICVDGGYACPIEGCGKHFRKENLAQMHIKHYHPEFSKFIGSTPNVADLAYARTVGEDLDFVAKIRFTQTGVVEKKSDTAPKTPSRAAPKVPVEIKTPVISNVEIKTEIKVEPSEVKAEESEIVKLLNSETKVPKSQESLKIESKLVPLKSEFEGSPKLTAALLEPREKVPRYPDTPRPPFDLKPSETRPVGGIKTLLPVVRVSEEKVQPSEDGHKTPVLKSSRKRTHLDHDLHRSKRKYTKHDYASESAEKKKSVDFADLPSTSSLGVASAVPGMAATTQADVQQPQTHFVTESGEVIKIVRMKQEEIINCTCGFMEEDGLMIQCELCLCWQHAYCNNIEREDQVPDKYICYICTNPLRMRSSQKYIHDQDWLKQGVLPTAGYHANDEDALSGRFERLRKSHELSGNLNDLNSVLHSLRVKIKIAKNKDHPKFYLWSKPWEKTKLNHNIRDVIDNVSAKPEKETKDIINTDIELSLKNLLNTSVTPLKQETVDNSEFKSEPKQTDSELFRLLDSSADDLKSTESQKIDLNTLLSSEGKNQEEKVLTPMDEHSKSTFYDSIKQEDKEEPVFMEAGPSEVVSELMSHDELAGDLLNSPTAALGLALTQSDIEKIQTTIDNSASLVSTCIPEPEAKIEPEFCRKNLIDNIKHYHQEVKERMDAIEEQIAELEAQETNQIEESKINETLIMLMRDLGKMRKLAAFY